MSLEQVKLHLSQWNRQQDILVLEASTATVEMAAQALGTLPERIAKTLSFQSEEAALLIVTAGDAKIDNRKFKDTFGFKAKMLAGDAVEALTGHAIGGVCPFAVPPQAKVYLDVSLKRFETVYPACGTSHSAICLTLPELEQYAQSLGWVDVCKAWQAEEA